MTPEARDQAIKEIISRERPDVRPGTATYESLYQSYASDSDTELQAQLADARGSSTPPPPPPTGDTVATDTLLPPGVTERYNSNTKQWEYWGLDNQENPKMLYARSEPVTKATTDKRRELNVPPPQVGEYGAQHSEYYGSEPDPNQLAAVGLKEGPLKGSYIQVDSGIPGKALYIDKKTGEKQFVDLPNPSTSKSISDKIAEQEAALGRPLTASEREQIGLYGSVARPKEPVDRSMSEGERARLGLDYEKFGYDKSQDEIKNALDRDKYGLDTRKQDWSEYWDPAERDIIETGMNTRQESSQLFQSEESKLRREQEKLIERSRLNAEYTRLSAQLAPKAIPPSLIGKDIPGYQPGGPVEAIYKRLGLSGFTPQKMSGYRPDVSGIEKALAELGG